MSPACHGSVLLCLAVLVSPLAGFEPVQAQGLPKSRISESVTVRVASVDAFVTSRAGLPLTDLRRDEFELFEDGKPVEISSFLPPDERENSLVSGSEAAAGTEVSFVLLLDNATMTPSQRSAALVHADALLRRLLQAPSTRVLIAVHGAAVQVLAPLTSDLPTLEAALARAGTEAGERAAANAEDAMLSSLVAAGATGSADFAAASSASLLESIQAAAQERFERAKSALRRITSFVSSLAGLPGRRAVFYIGSGIPMRPGETLLRRWETTFLPVGANSQYADLIGAGRYSLSDQFGELAARANASGVTIYCLETGELKGGATVNAQARSLDRAVGLQITEDLSRQDGLILISAATGGKAILNHPDLAEAMSSAATEFRSTYSLGFLVPDRPAGGSHKLAVKVRRAGAVVRHRSAWTERTADERVADRSFAAIEFGAAVNDLGVEVLTSVTGEVRGDQRLVTILITVPLGKLSFRPALGFHEAELSLWILSRDAAHRLAQSPRKAFPFRIPNDQLLTALGQRASYTFTVPFAVGEHTVAVSVRDELSGRDATVVTPLRVGATGVPQPGPPG